jgi:predicted aconitase with swiveling domain
MEGRAEMSKLILKGRKVNGGVAEGEALVLKGPLGGMGVFDVDSGAIIELGHEALNQNVCGKVVVFQTGRGSSSWTIWHQALRFAGNSPKAHIVKECNAQAALGAIVSRVPSVTDLDQDPTEVISTGDWVKVDGDGGLVEVTKKD